MKKLICALIGAASLVASATTYIQTSTTGTAPWKPVKDSVSQAHLADSARKADSTRTAWKADSARIAWFAHAATYADSSRVSGLADSAKRAAWAPLDSVGVRGIVGDTATTLRSNMAGYLPLTGGTLTGFLTGTSAELWTNKNAHDYGPALTLHGSIYTSDANLLLRSSAGYGNFVGFSDQSKSTGFQRWNLGVENDAFQIHANSSDGLGGESVLKLARNGNLTIRGTLTAFSFTGNAATATKLATARTISITGDGTWSTSFDGSANATGALTLATLLTAGSAGSATTVPTLTWDPKGRLIAAGSAAISIPHAQISDWGTYINQALLTTSSPTFVSISLGRGSVSNYVGSSSYGAIYGASVTPSSTNYSIAWNVNGASCEINGTASSSLSVNNANIATATASGLSVVGAISEGGTALSSKYLGIDASISHTKISDWNTATSSFLTGNQSISLTGAVSGTGTTSIATSFTNTHLAGINQELTTTSSPTFAGISTASTYGSCGIFTGNADNAAYTAYNLKIKSWWGIGFESYDNITRILFDTRTGNISTLGLISEGGTALSSKYLGINGTASNASALGGVGSDYFVRGGGLNYGARTTPLPNWSSGTSSSQQLMKTGAYDGNFPLSDMPTAGWWIINHVKHSDPSGAGNSAYWGFDLAAGMGTGGSTAGQYCVRTSTSNDWGAWHTLLHSDNYSSYAIPLTGSTAITGSFAPATNQYYDLGAPSYQWHNVMAKTFVENGTSLSGLYASLNNDNTLVGQNDFAGRTVTDGDLLVRGTFSTGFSVWSTNTARTLDIANTNVHIYNVVTNTQQTLPNGLYNGQVIFFKNNTQSGIVPVGSINSSSMPIEPLSTVMLVWDANNTIWL